MNDSNDSKRLLTPAELADWLQVDRAYVYEHAAKLGAYRLGSGPKARLRFDLDEVRARLAACSPGRELATPDLPAKPRKRRRSDAEQLGSNVFLLPIRGQVRAVDAA